LFKFARYDMIKKMFLIGGGISRFLE